MRDEELKLERERQRKRTPKYKAKRLVSDRANADAINAKRRLRYQSNKPLFGRLKNSTPHRDPKPDLDWMLFVEPRVENFEVLKEIDPAFEVRATVRVLDD